MKRKIAIQGLVLAGLVSMQLHAADTTVLTRAVTKLIKAHQEANLVVNDLQNQVANNREDIVRNRSRIERLEKNIDEIGASVKKHEEDIQMLKTRTSELSQTNAQVKRMIEEMKAVRGKVEKTSNKVVGKADLAYRKALDLEEEVSLLKESIARIGAKASKNRVAIKSLEDLLLKFKMDYSASIAKLRQELESLKHRLFAEKVKNVSVSSKPKPCVIGCDNGDETSDQVINSYISK